jgi:hypothetical protein
MPAADPPKVIQVPVKRYDINLTLDDILTPLTQMSARLSAQAKAAYAPGSDVHQHVQQLSELARQLKDVIDRINKADPSLLAPTNPEPPRRTR